jgi:hypothetical protein
VDVDVRIEPESGARLRAMSERKDRLGFNVELAYLTVGAVDGAITTPAECGDTLAFGPTDIPGGRRIAVPSDPQDGFCAIFEGEVDA